MSLQETSYSEKLRAMLHQIFPEAKDVASNTQVTINCPLCARDGDPDHGHHMYINLGLNGKPPMFNCFRRTGHSGLLTKQALEQLSNHHQCLDPQLMTEIEFQAKASSNYGTYRLIKNKPLSISVKEDFSNSLTEHKIKYVSDRIGVELTNRDLVQNKIVLSLYDFLYSNYIKELTRERYVTDILDQHYIGFLTNTNASLIMRNTLSPSDKLYHSSKYHEMRYVKYNIINNPPTSYYFIPTTCDIYKPIEIHIAEGTFDILSVFYNLCNGNRSNKIYAAIGSKAYLNLIKYFFTVLGLINVTFHIYIDSGIERMILDEIARTIKPLEIDIWIHINTYNGEKDFGVPLSRISHYYYKL